MKSLFLEALERKVVVCDGAMGTNLQTQNLTSADFDGKDGCNEILVLTKPEAVRKVHEGFLAAGCDAIETNTFGASRANLADYGLEDRVHEINQKAAALAREAASRYATAAQPRFVLGSVGPGTKLPSLGHISVRELKDNTKEQIRGLLAGGVDALIIETCQDLLQTKTSVIGALEVFSERQIELPIIVQVTFETTGTMLLGTDMSAVIAVLESFPVHVLGMNCATGPVEMADHLRTLCENSVKYVSALPNAGLPENVGGHAHYKLTPQELADFHERFVREFGVNMVGGCCGTSYDHLAAVAKRVRGMTPKKRSPKHEASCASLYSGVSYKQTPAPLLVGEQTNANGSKKFKQTLEREDYDGLVSIAREAVKEGAHIVDLCVAFVGRDETQDMIEAVTRYNQHVTVPLMIDSTEAPVIETALSQIAGKAIINSINLEDGEARMGQICPLAKKYGAGLVALTIDEKGMAKTSGEKFAIAKRIYDLATQKYGILPEDLFFDTLTFTIGSGDDAFRTAAMETLEAIRLIKKNLPEARTILGVSNISFGLAPHARHILNSVFLHQALEAGLDAAIVNAKKIMPLHKISAEDLDAAKNLLANHRTGEKDPLQVFIAHFSHREGDAVPEPVRKKAANIGEALKNRILDGEKENLEADLDEAMKQYAPLDIVNRLLLDGMKTVGELFGAGKMQLPFVLQSAEVMKRAVAYLEPFMEKTDGRKKGKLVLATVKGDVHDIGKNLVDIILTNNGYQVFNLGIKQPIDAILQAAREHQADAIGLSGLLVKSTLIMKENLEEMNQRGLTIPVICGGAALTRRYVEEDLAKTYHGRVYYGQDAFAGLRAMEEIVAGSAEAPKSAATSSKIPAAPCCSSHRPGPGDEASPSPHESLTIPLAPVPVPPYWGYRILKDIRIEEVFGWINKNALYRGQWQFRRQDMKSSDFERMLGEKVDPIFREMTARCLREKILEPKVMIGYFPCYSEKNDLVVLDESGIAERVRFHFPRQKKEPYRCISDFFRSKGSGETDVLALQLVTMGSRASEFTKKLFETNQYQDYLYLHGLSVEAAEGLAECVHALIRRNLGIHHDDSPEREKIFQQGYQGSRYSFGYPACPNLEDQKKFFELLPGEKIGVSLTEEFQLVPEQSTTALVVHHPKAKYFNV
ncbi:MAG: methionine synthase [Candidatus Omnitrophota bacterium]|jgi:5-methyltetrahydrofolate--homocysteine methyltransferase